MNDPPRHEDLMELAEMVERIGQRLHGTTWRNSWAEVVEVIRAAVAAGDLPVRFEDGRQPPPEYWRTSVSTAAIAPATLQEVFKMDVSRGGPLPIDVGGMAILWGRFIAWREGPFADRDRENLYVAWADYLRWSPHAGVPTPPAEPPPPGPAAPADRKPRRRAPERRAPKRQAPKRRAPWAQKIAAWALDDLYPDGWPPDARPPLYDRVKDWLAQRGRKPVSQDTLERVYRNKNKHRKQPH
jgi:hypothetical protein